MLIILPVPDQENLVLDLAPDPRAKESVNLYLKMVLFVSDYRRYPVHISLRNLKNA
jgi:hypothetical protein